MVETAKIGTLITFEGIEGCGKSTQITKLAERLEKLGFEVVISREPGATSLGSEIRALLLNPKYDPDALTELMLYLADRRDHCQHVVKPALERGAFVLLDRFVDSTWVYQGFAAAAAGEKLGANTVSPEIVDELNRRVTGSIWPTLTFLLDCPVEIGLNRARSRNLVDGSVGVADRFEQRQLNFHERVRAGFLQLAEMESERFCVVNAATEIGDLHEKIWSEFSDRIVGVEFSGEVCR